MKELRKIIRESLEFSQMGETIKNKIKPISDFKCINFSSNEWEFSKKTSKNSYYIKVKVKNKDNKWTFDIEVYWNAITNQNTSNRGKEYNMTFGPYASLDDMVNDVSRKLKNNPIMSPKVYEDDYDNNMDLDILKLIENLKKMGSKINSIGRKHTVFSDLCKIYDDTFKMSTDDIHKYIKQKYPNSSDKQTCTLTLQKMNKLDFYGKMKNFVS